jgi:hypothetical protein
MVKKFFALAGFTALSGLVFTVTSVGCSSSSNSGTSGEPAEAGGDAKPKDSSTPDIGTGDDDSGTGTTCPDTTPVKSADIDSQIHWKGPAAIASPCTGADIQNLQKQFDDTNNKTYDDIVKNFNPPSGAACKSCVVTPGTSATWGPIVQLDATTTFGNFGACFGRFPGSSPDCGKAIEYLNLCLDTACQDCASQTAFDNCTGSKGASTACAAPVKDLQTACAAVLTDISDNNSAINKACNDIIDAASTLCAGGTFDGGKIDP